MAGGYIARSFRSVGRITGSPNGRSLFGNNDSVYINTKAPAQVGDKFFIVRIGPEVFHPVTGQIMGVFWKLSALLKSAN